MAGYGATGTGNAASETGGAGALNWRLPEFLLAAGLAYCFAALGNIVLGRRATRLQDWNEAFLVGLSAAATLFYPLSLLASRHALLSIAVLLAVSGAVQLVSIRWPRRHSPTISGAKTAPTDPVDAVTVLLVIAIALAAAVFFYLNLRVSYAWDGFIIWATKAQVLYHTGSMTTRWWFPGAPERLMLYPQLVPLYEALVALVHGVFHWSSLKVVFPFFYFSLLCSTFRAARALVPPRVAYGAVALLAWLPGFFSEHSVGGYADMPQAAMAAGLLAASLSPSAAELSFRNPVAWLCGGLILVKSEGLILLVAFAAALILFWLWDGLRVFFGRIRVYRYPILVVSGCVLLRLLFLGTCGARDTTYGPLDRPHILQAARRLLEVPELCLKQMLAVREWGLLWPAFFLASIVLLVAGRRLERTMVLATLFAMAAYVSVYYLTNWDIRVHIPNSYDRLLCHLAPAATIILASAYCHLKGNRGGSAPKAVSR
jgi:hypothetical protein